ncbi:MAG: TatD family hydrolase [Candidatus Paceibacterota bacterium]|jgi:TatD DNase family protein
MPKYIDIHSHTNFKAFDEDRDAVISRALLNDTWVINIGTQYDTSKKAVEMTNEYGEGVYATIGLHPIHTGASYHDEQELGSDGQEFTSRGEIFDKEKYKELANNKKVVGIGECGLDYYHMESDTIEKQKTAFISQIELSNEMGLPLMLHIRNQPNASTPSLRATPQEGNLNAYADVADLLEKYSKRSIKGVSHFFAGSVEDMKRFIEIGIYISFAGPITYKPKPEICDYESVIRETPLEMILADTDSPYVAPVPHRGTRNEPSYVKDIVAKIAQIKGLDEEKVANQIVLNAKRLFDLS